MKTKGPVANHGGVEVKRSSLMGGNRVCPSTPGPSWKLYNNPFYRNQKSQRQFSRRRAMSTALLMASARRLAATIWELTRQCPANPIFPSCGNKFHYLQNDNDPLLRSDSMPLDEATPMDGFTSSSELFRFYSRMKVLEEQQTANMSLVQTLRSELDMAHAQVQELEFAEKTSRREINHLLRKFAEQKALWRSREQERIQAAAQAEKEELDSERKAKRRIEVLNRKLARELAEAKRDILELMQELEKERKSRQVMEDVCDELAREIGEDKTQAEELRRKYATVREELEEERRMLQMADILREERVQMKLETARLFLEEKHTALEKLRSELEDFLYSGRGSRSDDNSAHMQQAEMLRDAVSRIRVKGITELRCQPLASDGDISGDEDLHSIDINNEGLDVRSTRDCLPSTSPHGSTRSILNPPAVTPESQGISTSPTETSSYAKPNTGADERKNGQVDEAWDAENRQICNGEGASSDSHEECEDREEGLSDSHEENKELSRGEGHEMSAQSEMDLEDDDGSKLVIASRSGTERQLKRADTFAGSHWSSSPGEGEFCNKNPTKTRFSTPAKYWSSPEQSVVHGACLSLKNGGKNTPEKCNPHIARGIKGFIEWPKGIRQNSLKARLLEAKVESQKSQLKLFLKKKASKN